MSHSTKVALFLILLTASVLATLRFGWFFADESGPPASIAAGPDAETR